MSALAQPNVYFRPHRDRCVPGTVLLDGAHRIFSCRQRGVHDGFSFSVGIIFPGQGQYCDLLLELIEFGMPGCGRSRRGDPCWPGGCEPSRAAPPAAPAVDSLAPGSLICSSRRPVHAMPSSLEGRDGKQQFNTEARHGHFSFGCALDASLDSVLKNSKSLSTGYQGMRGTRRTIFCLIPCASPTSPSTPCTATSCRRDWCRKHRTV